MSKVKLTKLEEETLISLLLGRIRAGQNQGFIETKDWRFRYEIQPKTIQEQMQGIGGRLEENEM